MAEGIQPGPLLGEALAYAHKLRLAGRPKGGAAKAYTCLDTKRIS